jgi:hypothetical protein
MVKLIILGRCCRISFDMIKLNLKTKTSLFEWVWTDTLTEINTIIEKLIHNTPLTILRHGGNDYFADTNIKTAHYQTQDYNAIVDRRSKRFMNDIRKNKEVLFIRDDVLGTIKKKEIEKFYSLIKTINPELDFKFLLVSEINQYKEIIYQNLHHKIYNPTYYKTYINQCYKLEDNIVNTDIHDLSD